jgi:DNA primase
MDISESVLFNELAQLSKKAIREASKASSSSSSYRPDPNEPPMEVLYPEMVQLQKTPQATKVNELTKYEREIIKILLLYGNLEVEFVDYVEGELEEGQEVQKLKKEKFTNLVSSEIYLNLQDDEVEFTDALFKQIYVDIILQLNQEQTISVNELVNNPNAEISNLVTSILMDDEKHVLSDWGRKEIIIKSKESNLAKMVQDAIYNLRRVLIEQKISSLIKEIDESQREQTLESVVNYTQLKIRLANMLGRVV